MNMKPLRSSALMGRIKFVLYRHQSCLPRLKSQFCFVVCICYGESWKDFFVIWCNDVLTITLLGHRRHSTQKRQIFLLRIMRPMYFNTTIWSKLKNYISPQWATNSCTMYLEIVEDISNIPECTRDIKEALTSVTSRESIIRGLVCTGWSLAERYVRIE